MIGQGAGRRVVITNCVALNGGDAAILEALAGCVRNALGSETQIVVVDDQPEAVSARFPGFQTRSRLDKTFDELRGPMRRLRRPVSQVRRLRLIAGAWFMGRERRAVTRLWLGRRQREALGEFYRADAVISTGGTYLVENYSIAGRLLELEIALAMRRPLALFTQSLGPFNQPAHRRAVRRILTRARLVLLRDERSRQNLIDIGLSGRNLRVAADGVFAFPLRSRPRGGAIRQVAISVRDWQYAEGDLTDANEAYRAGIARLVVHLVQTRRVKVTFISTCQGVPEYRLDDSAVAVEIAKGLPPAVRAAVDVDRGFYSPQNMLDRLEQFDLVVATRMHMAILSLVAGTPVFPIAYEFKTRELFQRLGLGDCVYDFEAVGSTELTADVDRLADALPDLMPGLLAAIEAEHVSAVHTSTLLRAALVRCEPGGS